LEDDNNDGIGFEGNSDSDSELDDDDLVLTEIEARVVANNAKLYA
jgi:hypothetical protein